MCRHCVEYRRQRPGWSIGLQTPSSAASGSVGELPIPDYSAPVPDTRTSKQVFAFTAGGRIQLSVQECSRTIGKVSER